VTLWMVFSRVILSYLFESQNRFQWIVFFGLNRVSANKYIGNLKTVNSGCMISATLNLMKFSTAISESGLTCVHKPVKVLAPKGKRTVSSTTSGELGQMTTYYCCCMHAVRLVCMSHQWWFLSGREISQNLLTITCTSRDNRQLFRQ
jgi:hypothetical protein